MSDVPAVPEEFVKALAIAGDLIGESAGPNPEYGRGIVEFISGYFGLSEVNDANLRDLFRL